MSHDSGEFEDSWLKSDFEKKGREDLEVPDARTIHLKSVRNEYTQLDEQKLKDLNDWCNKHHVPHVHYAFLKALHSVSSTFAMPLTRQCVRVK